MLTHLMVNSPITLANTVVFNDSLGAFWEVCPCLLGIHQNGVMGTMMRKSYRNKGEPGIVCFQTNSCGLPVVGSNPPVLDSLPFPNMGMGQRLTSVVP